MKIIQEIVYGVVLAHIFFNWYRSEQKADSDAAPIYTQPRPSE
jgi:putative membrane protein